MNYTANVPAKGKKSTITRLAITALATALIGIGLTCKVLHQSKNFNEDNIDLRGE